MSKFNSVDYETFQAWHVYMKDLMDQKQAWYDMVEKLPERNMAQSYQHKIVDISDKPFTHDGRKLSIEFMASKDQNNICFYLVDADGDDSGTKFLCGEHIGLNKFGYTNDPMASDVAGAVLSFLRNNGYLVYNN